MAANLVVNFLGNNKLSKTTSVVQKNLKDLGRTGERIGNTLNRTLGAVGLGLTFAALTKTLKDATKAAIEDNKGQALLAESLRNTIGASSGAITSTEAWIKKTQLATSVADDELRPALTTAVTATGSLAKGQRLLTLALDISAAKQLDLKSVTNALSKAQGGNLTSLKKLLPGIQLTGDYMGVLESHYRNMAALSASNDPFQRMNIIFQDLQETIGNALLPYLQEVSNYLASPKGQANLKRIVEQFVAVTKVVGQVIGFLAKHIELIMLVVKAMIVYKITWGAVTLAIKVYEVATKLATISTIALRTAMAGLVLGSVLLFWDAFAEGAAKARKENHKFNNELQRSDKLIGGIKIKATGRPWLNNALGLEKPEKVVKPAVKKIATTVNTALTQAKDQIKKTAENFRDTIGLAFGVTGQDEYSFFNVDRVIDKLKRVVDAAKGFAGNIEKLKKAGAGQDVINELIGMGPAQGNIVAQGLLKSGRLSEYLGLRGQLYSTGSQVGKQLTTASTSNYTINLNKANVSASDIIRAIQAYEKKTGRKYFAH